jgi:hypothetical protein
LHRICTLISSAVVVLISSYFYYITAGLEFKGLPNAPLESVLNKLDDLKVSYSTSKELSLFNEIQGSARILDSLRTASMLGLWLLLFRSIMFLSVHPHLAILTDTLRIGAERLLYFMISFLTLLIGFTVTYVIAIDDSVTLSRAMLRLSGFVMGNPDFKADGASEILFAVIFGLVMCVTCLYWLLALAVSAYDEYLQDLCKLGGVTKPFLTDIRLLLFELIVGCWFNWPSRARLISILSEPDCSDVNTRNVQRMINWYSNHFVALKQADDDPERMPEFVNRWLDMKTSRARRKKRRAEIEKIARLFRSLESYQSEYPESLSF